MASHDEVAHNWAHQTGRAKKGHSMFYDGDTIYSYGYHFPIARLVGDCVLFTSRDYSVSTSKHKTIVRRAIDCANVHEVDNVKAETPAEHEANHDGIIARRDEALKRAARARKYAENWLHMADRLRITANHYAVDFKLTRPAIPYDAVPDMAALRQKIAEQKKEQARKDKEKIKKWLRGETDHAPHTGTPYVRIRGDIVETSYGIRVPLFRAMALHRLAGICKRKRAEYRPTKRQKIDWHIITRIGADGQLHIGCHHITYAAQLLAFEYFSA